MASIAAGVPFGFGMVLVFLGIMNYLIDAYTVSILSHAILRTPSTNFAQIFAASVLAANAVLRSVFGAAFPLFTTQMYHNLGIHWASTIPAFLALVCVPFPFLFYKYGPKIRARCKYAEQAAAFMRKLQNQIREPQSVEEPSGTDTAVENEETKREDRYGEEKEKMEEEEEEEEEGLKHKESQEAVDSSFGPDPETSDIHFEKIRTQSRPVTAQRSASYDGNPFDLDRINTGDSFPAERKSKSDSRRPSWVSSRTGRNHEYE